MNYCRNPDNDPLGLWCITNLETMEMDYCDVPYCSKSLSETKVRTRSRRAWSKHQKHHWSHLAFSQSVRRPSSGVRAESASRSSSSATSATTVGTCPTNSSAVSSDFFLQLPRFHIPRELVVLFLIPRNRFVLSWRSEAQQVLDPLDSNRKLVQPPNSCNFFSCPFDVVCPVV